VTVAFAINLLLVGSIGTLAALFGERAARWLRVPSRHVWTAALLFTIALPLLSFAAMSLGPIQGAGASLAESAHVAILPGEFVAEDLAASTLIPDLVLPAWVLEVDSLVLALWCVAVLVALVRLGSAHWRLRRQSRSWPLVDITGYRARLSSGVGPAVAGVLRPAIVIPEWALDSSSAVVRLMLAHEREHLLARDPLLLLLADIAVALVPWHPALHWQRNRLRLAVELDCDARVLRKHRDTRRYAELLLRVAQRPAPAHEQLTAAVALAPRPSTLERRIAAMTENRSRSPLAALLAASAAGVLVISACEAPRATAPLPEQEVPVSAMVAELRRVEPDSSVVVMRAQGLTVLERDTLRLVALRGVEVRDSISALQRRGELDTEKPVVALYVVDGVIVKGVDEISRLSIAPDKIESVEVLKGAAATSVYGAEAAGGVVAIRLKEAEYKHMPAPHGVAVAPSATVAPTGIARPAAPAALSVTRSEGRPVPAASSASSATVIRGDSISISRGSVTGNQIRIIEGSTATVSGESLTIIEGSKASVSGEGISISTGSPASRSGPLIIVDGIVYTDPDGLQSLSPDRIKSVEVIKGDAGVRLYGSRAVNGVIVVTTKGGK